MDIRKKKITVKMVKHWISAQRSYGISTLGGIQNPNEHSPMQENLISKISSSKRRFGLMTSRGVF